MADNDGKNTDLARAEILWKSADALRGQIDAAEYKHADVPHATNPLPYDLGREGFRQHYLG